MDVLCAWKSCLSVLDSSFSIKAVDCSCSPFEKLKLLVMLLFDFICADPVLHVFAFLHSDTFKGSFYGNPILDEPTTDVSLLKRY